MVTINGKQYKEILCYRCSSFVIYANVSAGILAIGCPKCGFFNEWSFKYIKTKENTDNIEKKYSIEGR